MKTKTFKDILNNKPEYIIYPKPHFIIYRIWSRIDGRCYIGCTKHHIKKRISGHYNCIKNGLKHPLYDEIRKHGTENFGVDILFDGEEEWVYSWKFSNFKSMIFERYFQEKHRSFFPYGFNKPRERKYLKIPSELLTKKNIKKIQKIMIETTKRKPQLHP